MSKRIIEGPVPYEMDSAMDAEISSMTEQADRDIEEGQVTPARSIIAQRIGILGSEWSGLSEKQGKASSEEAIPSEVEKER